MGALSSLASVGLNLALADQAQKRQAREVNAKRGEDVRNIEQRDSEERRRAMNQLQRQLAAQRARAGAAGLGNSGSTTAVLRGLVQEAATAEQVRRDQSARAIEAINRGARNRKRTNLLDLAGTTARNSLSQFNGSQRRSLLDR